MKSFTPILIMTLNRFIHFKRCIESLKRCEFANNTDLFIALDYPSTESHFTGFKQISEYIETIDGFKSVNLIKRTQNYGSAMNAFAAISSILELYDQLIFSEDDNEFARDFLTFINQGLETYKDRKDIFSISGYNSPISMPEFYKKDVYLRIGFTAWGVGIWKDKWAKVDWTMNEFNTFVDDKTKMEKFAKISEQAVPHLIYIRETQAKLGDGIIAVHLFNSNMFSIYPVISRVRNHGHDGSGEHAGVTDRYTNQAINEKEEEAIFPRDIQPDYKLMQYVHKQFNFSWIERIKQKIPSQLKSKIKWIVK